VPRDTQVQQKTLIPVANQTLSLDRAGKEVLSSGANTLTSLGIRHGQMVFLSYTGERPINNDEDPKYTTPTPLPVVTLRRLADGLLTRSVRAHLYRKLRNIKKKWDLKSLMEHLDSQGLVFKAQVSKDRIGIGRCGDQPLNACVAAMVMQETTHCKVASLDFASCDKFQQYPREFAFLKRREGYLYGKYLEDGNVTGTSRAFALPNIVC
jgi:hypothetical protein